jgi:hypothetical protein
MIKYPVLKQITDYIPGFKTSANADLIAKVDIEDMAIGFDLLKP